MLLAPLGFLTVVAASSSHMEGVGLLQVQSHQLEKPPQTCKSLEFADENSLSMSPLDDFEIEPDVERIGLIDFPTCGSSWLRMIMRRIAWSQNMKSPIAAVYSEEPFTVKTAFDNETGLFVDTDWDSSAGTLMFKTHWPVHMDMDTGDRSQQQLMDLHTASVRFDKAVVMLRHPHALTKACYDRWSGIEHPGCYASPTCVAEGIACWARFWDKVLEEKKAQDKVLYVKYEELCMDPVKYVSQVFNFIGGIYADIPLTAVQDYFTSNYTDWRECIYDRDTLNMQAAPLDMDSGKPLKSHSDGTIDEIFDGTFLQKHYLDYSVQAVQKHQKEQPPQTCKSLEFAEENSLSLSPLDDFKIDPDVERVGLIDFPTCGSSWLRMMMRRIAWSQNMKSPIAAVYNEEPFTVKTAFDNDTGLFVDTDWDSSAGTLMFKTHWPVHMDMDAGDLSQQQLMDLHTASVRFDKAVVMLRHPHALTKACYDRWGGIEEPGCFASPTCVAEGIACWARFWDEVLEEKKKQDKVLYVKYEDLCVDPVKYVSQVFDFIGGIYADIPKKAVKDYFTSNYTDWRECIYDKDTLNMQAAPLDMHTGSPLLTHSDGSINEIFDGTFLQKHYLDYSVN